MNDTEKLAEMETLTCKTLKTLLADHGVAGGSQLRKAELVERARNCCTGAMCEQHAWAFLPSPPCQNKTAPADDVNAKPTPTAPMEGIAVDFQRMALKRKYDTCVDAVSSTSSDLKRPCAAENVGNPTSDVSTAPAAMPNSGHDVEWRIDNLFDELRTMAYQDQRQCIARLQAAMQTFLDAYPTIYNNVVDVETEGGTEGDTVVDASHPPMEEFIAAAPVDTDTLEATLRQMCSNSVPLTVAEQIQQVQRTCLLLS